MESLIVTSKVKKFIKEKSEMNVSANFFGPVNNDIAGNINTAIEHTKKSGRKTVMGKDFSLYVENPNIVEVLVVTSKIKKYIKEKSEFSTSSQVMEQLTLRVQKICEKAIDNAKNNKRKTV